MSNTGQIVDEYQIESRRTRGAMPHYTAFAAAALGVAGEAGEVADIIKKYLFHSKPLDAAHLMEEVGDELFYLAWVADLAGFSLADAMQGNVAKLRARHPNGFDPSYHQQEPK